VTHWTDVLTNVSLVEFVALAVLTAVQWVRHRIRGAGWVAMSFAILGGVSLVAKYVPSALTHEWALKTLLAAILLMPYCLFRFTTSFRPAGWAVHTAALGVTAGIIAFTYALDYIPLQGMAAPPAFLAYRVAFAVAFAFLFTYVIVQLVLAGRGEPPLAATRMHLLAIAVAGFQVQVAVSALGLHGATVRLVTQALSVAMGLLFLMALVLPSFLRVFLSRKENLAFRRAMGELVSASDSKDVAERLLPHVCALVGASSAALLSKDGTVVARYPVWRDGAAVEDWRTDAEGSRGRITVRTPSGTSHILAVRISPYMPYFGTDELHKLDQLAGMVGLAIERCEMAEQVAFQATHDSLTGLANRSLFTERLGEALRHVGRRRQALAVLFIDLDRFKLVNDRADHSAGDIVLTVMASRLGTLTRGVDVVARFGGDEFVAFAEVDTEQDAVEMAERIRKGLGAPVDVGEGHLVVTASIGLVVTSEASTTPAVLLRDADNAMYDAKKAGRNQVVVYRANARDTANLKWGLSPSRASRLNAG
jgi:diguanylate cyclase (GGDEF)-like protein